MATLPVDGNCTATSKVSAESSPAHSGTSSASAATGVKPDSAYNPGFNSSSDKPKSGTSTPKGSGSTYGACHESAPHEMDTSGMPRHLVYALESVDDDFNDGASAGLATSYRACSRRRSAYRGARDETGEDERAGRAPLASEKGKVGARHPNMGRGILLDTHTGGSLGAVLGNSVGFSTVGAAGAAQSLNTNVMAINAYRNVTNAHQILNDSLLKLTSGNRINTAGDDAAGLAIAENMRSQMLGSKQAVRNAQDGISLVQTAEGVLGTVHGMLQRMRVLAVQGANDSNAGVERGNIVTEMDAIRLEIGRIGEATEVLGRKILGGKYVEPADALRFQIGANGTEMETIAVTFVDVVGIARDQLGHIPQDATHEGFQGAIRNIDDQIQVISAARATLGAVMSRFESTINNLNVTVENLASACGRIQDVDFGAEASQFMRGQILTQSSHAMLSHATLAPRGVLSLLSVA